MGSCSSLDLMPTNNEHARHERFAVYDLAVKYYYRNSERPFQAYINFPVFYLHKNDFIKERGEYHID